MEISTDKMNSVIFSDATSKSFVSKEYYSFKPTGILKLKDMDCKTLLGEFSISNDCYLVKQAIQIKNWFFTLEYLTEKGTKYARALGLYNGPEEFFVNGYHEGFRYKFYSICSPRDNQLIGMIFKRFIFIFYPEFLDIFISTATEKEDYQLSFELCEIK